MLIKIDDKLIVNSDEIRHAELRDDRLTLIIKVRNINAKCYLQYDIMDPSEKERLWLELRRLTQTYAMYS